ncbi:MAG TPA: bifunctional adenosylcobinamide kinase/adenosylcobinamide-phosphate guanylyltransferase [Streptosporangiaceae bacterium]|nr:bifunctional adenosylcobinamide kinase/adenosylcobinamide-phosphate guanylyltransferase [Streptosporangiaceae bacterium]
MDVCLVGTGGSGGWPRPGCGCASCARARAAGRHRSPARVVVDGVLSLEAAWPAAAGPPARAAGYRVEAMPGGWTVTAPDGGRLLAADGSGVPPEPPDGAGPYDIALLDLLGDPAQLGALRRRGLVGARTVVAVLHADHRVPAEEDLARRGRYWGVVVPADGDVLAPGAASAGPGPGPRRVLVLGGARSGKSRHAELRLAGEPRVTYLAADPYLGGSGPADDPDWAERVAAHRDRRPPWWQTVESLDAAETLRAGSGAVLFDGAGTWLAAMMERSGAWDADGREASRLIAAHADELVEAWRQTRARVVAVSDEVGASVHPPSRAGRLFRDQLGWLNQRLAAESEETVLMVAGRPLTLLA